MSLHHVDLYAAWSARERQLEGHKGCCMCWSRLAQETPKRVFPGPIFLSHVSQAHLTSSQKCASTPSCPARLYTSLSAVGPWLLRVLGFEKIAACRAYPDRLSTEHFSLRHSHSHSHSHSTIIIVDLGAISASWSATFNHISFHARVLHDLSSLRQWAICLGRNVREG